MVCFLNNANCFIAIETPLPPLSGDHSSVLDGVVDVVGLPHIEAFIVFVGARPQNVQNGVLVVCEGQVTLGGGLL